MTELHLTVAENMEQLQLKASLFWYIDHSKLCVAVVQ